MSESTSDDGCGCLSVGGGVLIIGALIAFLQWLWGILVAVAIWLWLAPGRLVVWILSWPLFSGHLLLGLLAAAATGDCQIPIRARGRAVCPTPVFAEPPGL